MSEYRELSLAHCKEMIKTHHYSNRLPATVKLCYGHFQYSPERQLGACCVFSAATGRWEANNLWELTRLVRLPGYESPLTKLIGKAVGLIRQKKATELIVSFADLEEDHHGGIYQACSWVYDGITETRLDGFNIDGEFVPARTCNQRYKTSSVKSLQAILKGRSVEPHFDQGKHLYWKALSKEGMKMAMSLGLKSQPYPKPMLQSGVALNVPTIDPQLRKGKIVLPSNSSGSKAIPSVALDIGASVVDEQKSARKNPRTVL